VIPLEVIAGVFFALISLMFIGIGQTMGQTFNRIPNHVEAYTVNLLGSLAGIAGFAALCFFRTPPTVWFAVCFVLNLCFIKRSLTRWLSAAAAIVVLGALITTADLPVQKAGTVTSTTWSPYYKVCFENETGNVYVNNILHQKMEDMSRGGFIYRTPYLMNQAAGGSAFEDVLIIGAGSGNDVVAALEQKARQIDAVEIDPVLHEIGSRFHPNRHGGDPRVIWHIDDGRSFVRSSRKKYDLIVYALVDSLVLHSGYSSIRLESFLFTKEALLDLKDHLKPGGVLVMYNLYRQGWVVGRLTSLTQQVFGTEPIVLTLPYQDSIAPGDNQGNRLTYILAGTEGSGVLRAIRARLKESQFFWLHPTPAANGRENAFRRSPPIVIGTQPREWFKLGPARVQTEAVGRLPTDNLPFLYLRDPLIPGLNLRGMLIVATLSCAVLFSIAPVRGARPNGQMFFLGAGFMLLETKGVVHLALLFGSTWMVNSIVFAAILTMAVLSNLFVVALQPRRLWPYYSLLIASLALNLAVPMTSFLELPGLTRVVASCLVVFVPVFFAGVVFSASFRDCTRADVAFGSNIGGVILGGLSENFSLMIGFSNLLILATVYYLLSAALAPRKS
jgi:spermidine synthase